MTIVPPGTLTLVQSFSDVERFMSWLGERRELLAVDTETTGLNVGKDRIRLVQVGDADAGWAFPYPDWKGIIKEVVGGGYSGPIAFWNALF